MAEAKAPTEQSPESFWVRHRYLVLLGLGMLVYLPWLGLRGLWYPDEPDIGQVCQAMFTSGDWIAPRRNGVIWVDYPPMIYWVGTIASHVFGGMTSFALRIPNALTAVATGLLACAAGTRWFGARAGLWAGFMLLTFLQYVYEGVSYRPDVTFTFAISLGLFMYAQGVGQRPRLLLRVGGFALLGAAMLAKGPLGLLLPGLVLSLWHVSRREWRRWLELAPLALVSMAVYLPWFVACARAMGADSILYELYAQNVGRFFSGSRGHEQAVYYYVTRIWSDLFPWSVLFPFAVVWLARGRQRGARNVQLLMWWVGVFVAFLSVATTKRQLYLLPVYPAIALLIAPWVDSVTRGGSRDPAKDPSPKPALAWSIIAATLLGLVGLGLVGLFAGFHPVMRGIELSPLERETALAMRAPIAVLGFVLIGGAVAVGLAWYRGDTRGSLVRLGLAQIPMYLVVLVGLLPAMDPVRSYGPAGRWIREQIGDDSRIGLVNRSAAKSVAKMGAFGFYSETLVDILREPGEIEDFFERHPGSVVMIEDEAVDQVFLDDEGPWRDRVIREVQITGDTYLALGAPPGDGL